MREDQINVGLGFLRSPNVQGVPVDERRQFLEGKLTEEEITECLRRYKEEQKSGVVTKQPKIINSPVTQQRLETHNNHFMTAINVASLAVVTSMGVNYLLDNFRDKKETMLREEVKDRAYSTMKESHERLRSLETKYDQMNAKLVEADEVETIVQKRLEQFENGLQLTDVKTKTLNLKVRAQPSQSYGGIGQNSEVETLRLEMVKELRDMKDEFRRATETNQDIIRELKQMNTQIVGGSVNIPSTAPTEVQTATTSSSAPVASEQKPPTLIQPEKVGAADLVEAEELNKIDLTEAQMSILDILAEKFVESFESKNLKQTAIKWINMPFSKICNSPSEEKWRTVTMTNPLLRPVINANQEAVEQLLSGIGFTKTNPTVYKFQKSEENQFSFNLRALEYIMKKLNQLLADLDNPVQAPPVQVQIVAQPEVEKVEQEEEVKVEEKTTSVQGGDQEQPVKEDSQPLVDEQQTSLSKVEEDQSQDESSKPDH